MWQIQIIIPKIYIQNSPFIPISFLLIPNLPDIKCYIKECSATYILLNHLSKTNAGVNANFLYPGHLFQLSQENEIPSVIMKLVPLWFRARFNVQSSLLPPKISWSIFSRMGTKITLSLWGWHRRQIGIFLKHSMQNSWTVKMVSAPIYFISNKWEVPQRWFRFSDAMITSELHCQASPGN